MSAHLSVRVDRAALESVQFREVVRPHLRIGEVLRTEDGPVGQAVMLEADSLEALRAWLLIAASEVHDAIIEQRGEPDTDAAAADAGALA